MDYDHIYEELVDNTSLKICKTWPEKGFIYASWEDLAANIEAVYKYHGDAVRDIPHSVRVGYMDNTQEGMSLVKPSPNKCISVPLLFDWCAYRGLCLCSYDIDGDGDAAPISIVNQVGSAMLLRLVLHAEQGRLLVHKVDPLSMGKDMSHIPAQPGAPIIVKKEELAQLINTLKTQISRQPVAPMTWRCDANENAYASDPVPLQIVYIADWNDLYDVRMGNRELSDVQKSIIEMLSSDVPARNGIYFFICGSKENAFQDFREVLPTLAIDDCNNGGAADDRGYRAQLFSHIVPDKKNSRAYNLTEFRFNCKFALPTENELKAVLKMHRNYLSGALNDTEGEGIWLGKSSKGLRAIMGVTDQGENQFFELGVGQGYDAFHALIGGATGSGKSVLLSEIICSLAERYSPSELRMLLLDYKEGTEFAPFSNLPHVYALSMGSNPEFGLEVLKEVQKEIGRRGRLFKEAGNAKNLDEYRNHSGETLCRYVLVADEFQVLLGDKKYGEEAKSVLNDLVRRGRSFGFHAILATQTLRDGALDGEAKNQFGCRIAMRMAESETDYFLASGNTVPSTFNRKGQALVNYALGRKESNVIFQSGNKTMPKKFRDTSEVLKCVSMLREKAEAEQCFPSDVYIYNSDGFADMPNCEVETSDSVIIGLRNDMRNTPIYLNARQLSGKVLILGDNKKKRQALLNLLANQCATLYNEPVSVQSPSEYLDGPSGNQVTILNVSEGDFDLEDAIADWLEDGSAAASTMTAASVVAEMPTYTAPVGMESEFAELMQSMQTNNASMGTVATTPRRSRRNRDSRCLIVAISNAADIKLMEAGGMYVNDFRSVIYLDNAIFNQVSGEYEKSTLGEAAALLESPRGVVSKIRIIK